MRIAVFGGSFDPVHVGHLALADAVRAELCYDTVLFVPANESPHKVGISVVTPNDRLAMLTLAVAGNPAFSVDDCELARGGVSYTVETLRALTKKNADSIDGKLGFVIGEDLVDGFSTWRDVPGILEIADLIVARRPGGSARPFPHPHARLENELVSVSSSAIRAAIESGKSWRYLVPESVYRYIVSHRLYER